MHHEFASRLHILYVCTPHLHYAPSCTSESAKSIANQAWLFWSLSICSQFSPCLFWSCLATRWEPSAGNSAKETHISHMKQQTNHRLLWSSTTNSWTSNSDVGWDTHFAVKSSRMTANQPNKSNDSKLRIWVLCTNVGLCISAWTVAFGMKHLID